MIRRLFYMALGAYLAVWAMRKLQSLRPDHVARRAVDELKDFAGDVRRLSAARESELRAELGLDSVDASSASRNDDVKDGR
jgi:uncharacterized membrane protein YccC